VDEALVITRLVHFAASMAAFGASAFGLYAFDRIPLVTNDRAVTGFDNWNVGLVQLSAWAVLISGLALLPFVAAQMAGNETAAVDPKTIALVLHDTAFGHVWCFHLLFTLILTISAVVARRHHALNLLWSGLALASLGWVGHAASGSGWVGIGRELNQSVHLLAAGLWLGGLLPLGWLLAHSEEGGFGAIAGQAVPAFSRMGYGAVAIIAITGIVNSLTLVGNSNALFGTDYGRLLSLKILLYLAMVALALRNRFRLMPRLADANARGHRALYRSVMIEQAVGLGILAAVSLLGTWPPPFMHHH
jgi:copper resistance protein D